ncbi:hydrogenase maturation nickel metallochaperone HypA [Pararhodospirillum photometricum]|uniref:Hydrogenase maturation factor HypA n=1 Tax=Pararhodospirillum photometricum DSM 122 TaxID=1150469 RepID=H6SN19_PARPM|nr:hydrogenase maturation nickel metallochaperone HypA [Pararhodospirillum photometricum]CCG06895.1 Hydrogenase expression/synthesis, HypA [Pararhodospirillum photometricum DSM 122]
MHELALAQSLIDLIEREALTHGFTRVREVRIALGQLSHVDAEALIFGFTASARGTRAEGAHLSFLAVPGTAWCLGCDQSVPLAKRGDPCPRCGSYQLQVTGGDDLSVKDLEVV